MAQMMRLARYGTRFLFDRKYRNRILEIVNRQVQGSEHLAFQPAGAELAKNQFLRGKRLFVAAGCDQTFMAEYLESLGMETCHTFAIGRASDPMTELMMPGSRALSESWDYYLLSVSQVLRGLFRRIQVDGIDYAREQQEQDLESILANYRHAILAIRQKSDAPIFLFSYLITYLPTYGTHEYRSMKNGWSLIEFWHVYHLRLYELAREFSGVYIFDSDLAVENVGKQNVIDPSQSNGIYDHPSREGAKILGDHFAHHLSILEPRRRRIKCAVFDLDGTLWAGVVREDGAAGVAVQEYYLNVMEKLAARGILLAICSKNDPVELGLLPGLLGEELYAKIVSRQLSWKPKSQALRDIAEELNIGLDSLAFFDDSPFERGEVTANAPEVLVFTPEEIFTCLNLPEFHQMGEITHESLSRTVKYQQQAKRKEAEQTSATGLEDFLISCEFKLELSVPLAGEISRVFELLQRTNQLNATLTRTSQEQLKRHFAQHEHYLMCTARLRDRFGDYGLIGFATVQKDGPHWQVLDLAFSCRSAGRGVERAVLNYMAGIALAAGAQSLFIHFLPGPRNQQMFEILKESGFLCPEGVTPVEGQSMRLDRPLVDQADLVFPAWLSVNSGA